ncbi:MAG: ArsR/SmtB family transcription factor [Christensenellaceae bacterium]
MAYYVGVGVRPMMHVPYRERLSIDCDEILRTLADKNRMKIMQQLSAGKSYGQELADMLGLSPNTVSHHMNKLQKAGSRPRHLRAARSITKQMKKLWMNSSAVLRKS